MMCKTLDSFQAIPTIKDLIVFKIIYVGRRDRHETNISVYPRFELI